MSRMNLTEVDTFHKTGTSGFSSQARADDQRKICGCLGGASCGKRSVGIVVALLLLLLSGCDSDDEVSQDRDFAFPTGEFQVETHAVDDRCLDGGLNLLFMPNGDAQPWAWPFPVTLYNPEDLDQTYSLSLRDPFGEMEVTASLETPVDQRLQIHPNPSVKLGEERFGDCAVELGGYGLVTMVDSDEVEGVIFIEMSDPHGDERCPADMPDHCNVNVGFVGTRADGS